MKTIPTPESLHSRSGGQALVVLLFYMIVAITLITTVVAISISNSTAMMQEEQGEHALEIAESGAENALLRLLRDTGYGGETLAVDDGSAVVTVAGTSMKTITSAGSVGTFSKTVRVVATFTNGILTILSWHQV